MVEYKVFEISDGITKVAKKETDWTSLISNLNKWHAEIAETMLKPETLYYYTMNRKDSSEVPISLSSNQKELLNAIFKKFVDDPESFYDVFKQNEHIISEINSLKDNDELLNFISSNALDVKFDKEKEFAANKTNIIRELKLDRSYGIFGEFLFYSVTRELFNKDLLLSKVSLTTGEQKYAFGSDGIFFDSAENILVFGEAKFTSNLSSGLLQAFNSLQDLKSRIDSDITLIVQQTAIIKGANSLYFEEKSYNEVVGMRKSLYVFILYGNGDYEDETIIKIGDKYLEKFKLLDGSLESIIIIAFPIIDKNNLKRAIAQKVSENASGN